MRWNKKSSKGLIDAEDGIIEIPLKDTLTEAIFRVTYIFDIAELRTALY